MNKVVSIIGIAAAVALSARADQAVNFSNAAAAVGAGKLVTFDSSFPGLAGQGVVNNAAGNPASYVAALFVIDGAAATQVGGTAAFRAATTSQPGTWVGSTRTVVGPAQGTTLNLQVRAWDAAFSSMEAAQAAGKGWGQSATFTFKDALSAPPAPGDIVMANFTGFSITQIPEPSTIALGALGVAGLLFFRRK
jgi:hypothetical protein